jgi:glycosyltransferase involved in cell wall biosynthesis
MKTVMWLLGIPTGPYFWDWLCKHASSIITCHPRDIPNITKLKRFGKPIYYVPWPTYIPPKINSNIERKKYRGVYVGSLNPFKNTQEFEHTLPKILRETPTKEFIVVGPGAHSKIIKNLQKQTNGAIKYIPELSRTEALELIASSYYAYTPVKRGGWGFIADCWNMGTPLIMTHKEDNYALPGNNALSSIDEKGLTQSINQLYYDSKLRNRLQENSRKAVEEKQTNKVRNDLYSVFSRTLELNSKDF